MNAWVPRLWRTETSYAERAVHRAVSLGVGVFLLTLAVAVAALAYTWPAILVGLGTWALLRRRRR